MARSPSNAEPAGEPAATTLSARVQEPRTALTERDQEVGSPEPSRTALAGSTVGPHLERLTLPHANKPERNECANSAARTGTVSGPTRQSGIGLRMGAHPATSTEVPGWPNRRRRLSFEETSTGPTATLFMAAAAWPPAWRRASCRQSLACHRSACRSRPCSSWPRRGSSGPETRRGCRGFARSARV